MLAQDDRQRFSVRPAELEPLVKSAGAQDRGVDVIGTIARGHDDHAFVPIKAVELLQKGSNHLAVVALMLAGSPARPRAECIDLVDERIDGAWSAAVEKLARMAFKRSPRCPRDCHWA
ncbi:hypothetical protein FLP41_16030 [Paracoccus marcusii]|nr:hypothetical protein FLP41_16030 [Paracoccus marcusii]